MTATGSGVHIVLDNMKDRLTFSPYTSNLNDHNIFSSFAKEGDLIVKPAFSDTLKLYKDDKIYLYTFRKYD